MQFFQRNGKPSEAVFLTAFFAFFVFLSVINAFNVRTTRYNPLDNLTRNSGFLIVVTFIFAVQVSFILFYFILFYFILFYNCLPFDSHKDILHIYWRQGSVQLVLLNKSGSQSSSPPSLSSHGVSSSKFYLPSSSQKQTGLLQQIKSETNLLPPSSFNFQQANLPSTLFVYTY
jgi:hypothetical protein